MMPTLHPFQANLYDRVCAAARKGARIIVVQGATGSGKNTLGAFFVRQCVDRGRRALCMVHRRRLVQQISGRLEQFNVTHGVIMRGEPADHGLRVQVASRDTLLSRCIRNEWLGMPQADLVIVDEAHHAADAGSEYRRILNYYDKATILLLSATPVGPDGRGLGPWAQAIECAAPTTQLVREGFLMGLKCFAPDRKKRGKKYVRGIAGDLVESWQNHAENRATILFCSRVQHSRDAVEAFRKVGIAAAHMDAETPDDERDRVFEDTAAGRNKIISNVGIVGEGVDVPELGCCQLFCEVNSRTRLLQAAGRVMRPAPGKTHGILIDHSGAIFRHGFPDEDTEWTLEGNADEAFAKKQAEGATEKAYYCKFCSLVYHGNQSCPQCGREPKKPPRSIFAPPPMDVRNEILTEAERESDRVFSKDEKIRHWLRCLAVANRKNGSCGMASQIYKQKYKEWPGDDFPCIPERRQWQEKVADVFPNFGRNKAS